MLTSSSLSPHVTVGLVLERPFFAEVEFTHHENEEEISGKGFMARDGSGRQRYDIDVASGMIIVRITDPVGQKLYTINIASHTFLERPYPPDQQMWSGIPTLPPEQVEQRVIEGLTCFRQDHVLGAAASARFVTSWLSLDMMGLVAEEYETSSGARGSWNLRNIKLAEPGADLFRPPPGFHRM